MKNINLVFPVSAALAVALALTACGENGVNHDGASETPAVTEQVSDEASSANSDVVANVVAKILADGNGHVRYDRSQDEKTGKRQRQVFIEIVNSTAEQFGEKAEGYFEGTGYALGPVRSDNQGVRMTFVSEGVAPIRVLARNAEMGPALKVEGATASAYFTQDP